MRYLLLILALSAPCYGQVVTLPDKVEGGVSAFITIPAETDGETVKWFAVDPGLNVFPADLLKTTKTIVVSAPKAGRYRLMAYTAKGGVPSDPAETVVVVGTPGPGPTPGPDPPGPGPTPPVPELTETGKKVYEWSLAVGNKTESRQIAENYGAIISAIAAGAYRELSFEDARAKIVSDLLQLNRRVSAGKPKWATFSDNLAEHTKALDSEGKLDSVDKIKTMFEEIQAGLEASL